MIAERRSGPYQPWDIALQHVGDDWTNESDIADEVGVPFQRAHSFLLEWKKRGVIELEYLRRPDGSRGWMARRVA